MYYRTQFLVKASDGQGATKKVLIEVDSLLSSTEFDHYHLDEGNGPPAVSARDSRFWRRLRQAFRETTKEIVANRNFRNPGLPPKLDIWKMYRYAQLRMRMFVPGNYFVNLENWGYFCREDKRLVEQNPRDWWLVSVSLHH